MSRIEDAGKLHSEWVVRRYESEEAFRRGDKPQDQIDTKTGRILPGEEHVPRNLLLNEGIAELLLLLTGGTATAFDNANAYLGVGDSSASAVATQTGLQAATNKFYSAMEATYPQISAQSITWRAVFGNSEANFQWNEFTVANGNSDAADNLNRKVQDLGTKTVGTWTLDLTITFS